MPWGRGGSWPVCTTVHAQRDVLRSFRLAEAQLKFQNANYFYANAGKVFQLAASAGYPLIPPALPLPYLPLALLTSCRATGSRCLWLLGSQLQTPPFPFPIQIQIRIQIHFNITHTHCLFLE